MNRKKKNAIIIISFIIFTLGIILISYNYFIEKRDLAFEKINMQIDGNKEVKEINKETEENHKSSNETEENEQNKKNTSRNFNYIATIEIPKINLTKGLVDINSNDNTVDYNIQIIKPSDYPDVEYGNFILASHSGSSSISYFKHLYKLVRGDKVYIHYNNIKYIYEVSDIYQEQKNGYVNIKKESFKTTLTLITCTKNNNSTQTVYICNLVNKIEE